MNNTIDIIIPIHNDAEYTVDFISSIQRNSIYKHNIIVIADNITHRSEEILKQNHCEYHKVSFGNFYSSIQYGVDISDENILICNSDLLFGYKWDISLLQQLNEKDVDIVSPSLMIDLRKCGWRDYDPDIEKIGAFTPQWMTDTRSNFIIDKFEKQSEEYFHQYRNKVIEGQYHYIPYLMKKTKFYDVLGQDKFHQIGDMGFMKKVRDMKMKCRIALDSWCYHYVSVSLNSLGSEAK